VAIGTELLLGELTDTNSVHIARVLRDIGVNLYFMTSVGDNEARIASAIEIAMSRAQIVITCGGLGPTVDDMTRQSIAQATQRGLTFHQHLLDKIAERFSGFRVHMTDNNRRQAYLPDHAILIENPVGTAPSFIVEHEGSVVISLPGVPREMKYLLGEAVVPYLREKFNLGDVLIKAHTLKAAGIGESSLDDMIGSELLESSNPSIGLAAHSGQIDIRITAKAERASIADDMIATMEAQLRERVGTYIFGANDDTIEGALTDLLHQQGMTLAISETGIGSPVVPRVQSASNGTAVLVLSETHAAPDDLRVRLGDSADLTIQELAERAAETICRESGATVGIAVVSYPDMGEHHADVDAGSAISVLVGDEKRSRVYGFGGQSDTAKSWTGNWSLSMAWRLLLEKVGMDVS
jgi:nicotinamide-nucleotide amidase